jgi:hypothetical protein
MLCTTYEATVRNIDICIIAKQWLPECIAYIVADYEVDNRGPKWLAREFHIRLCTGYISITDVQDYRSVEIIIHNLDYSSADIGFKLSEPYGEYEVYGDEGYNDIWDWLISSEYSLATLNRGMQVKQWSSWERQEIQKKTRKNFAAFLFRYGWVASDAAEIGRIRTGRRASQS